jgi:hypothetical protein
MSDEFIVLVITIVLVALIFAWVPFLNLINLICRPCARFLERRRLQKGAGKKAAKPMRPRLPSARRIGLGLDIDN